MKYIFPILLLLIVLLVAPQIYTTWRTNTALQHKIDVSVRQLGITGQGGVNRAGHVEVEGVMRVLTEKHIHRFLRQDRRSANFSHIWAWGGVSRATMTALGIDRMHHFVNSYLVGYQPFESQRIWVPLYTLGLRKRYEYDHLQYSGLKDVWQNSRQAYYYTRGDCEDHAMILADWLIEMGIDARVVLGRHKEQGHAWVVFMRNGKVFLLEATSKKKSRRSGAIPEAAVMVHYHPMYQFNRDSFWVNTGSQFITRYTGPLWKRNSRFVAQERM